MIIKIDIRAFYLVFSSSIFDLYIAYCTTFSGTLSLHSPVNTATSFQDTEHLQSSVRCCMTRLLRKHLSHEHKDIPAIKFAHV